MEFKVCQPQRSELTNSAVSLIEQREIVKLLRLSELWRFRYGRFKLVPWPYGLHCGKHIAASGARLDESLAHASIEPYFLIDRFAAGVKLLRVRTFGFLEHLPD